MARRYLSNLHHGTDERCCIHPGEAGKDKYLHLIVISFRYFIIGMQRIYTRCIFILMTIIK